MEQSFSYLLHCSTQLPDNCQASSIKKLKKKNKKISVFSLFQVQIKLQMPFLIYRHYTPQNIEKVSLMDNVKKKLTS